MQQIPIPTRDTEPIDAVAPGIAGLRTIMVNLYGVKSADGGWVLIDAGLYFQASRIRRWAAKHFGARAPKAILLTHGHFDHVGSLQELAEFWNVPVYAHALEMPYLTGRSKYPPPDPTAGGGSLALLSFLYPRGPIDLDGRVRPLPGDGSVPGLPGWRWIHTPGHSPGHVSFFRDEDRALIAGDAFVTTRQESLTAVLRQRPEMHGPPAYYTMDWDAAALSVRRLSDLEPNVCACGHGLPVVGPDAMNALRWLADHFDEVARPWNGRYGHRPAVADERGVVHVPPSAVGPLPKLLLGAAVGGAVWYAVARRQSAVSRRSPQRSALRVR